MADANSKATLNLTDVESLLENTKSEISFIQSITLLTHTNEELAA